MSAPQKLPEHFSSHLYLLNFFLFFRKFLLILLCELLLGTL